MVVAVGLQVEKYKNMPHSDREIRNSISVKISELYYIVGSSTLISGVLLNLIPA